MIPAEGLAFLISAIIENLLLSKLFCILSLKFKKFLFLFIDSIIDSNLIVFFKVSIFFFLRLIFFQEYFQAFCNPIKYLFTAPDLMWFLLKL